MATPSGRSFAIGTLTGIAPTIYVLHQAVNAVGGKPIVPPDDAVIGSVAILVAGSIGVAVARAFPAWFTAIEGGQIVVDEEPPPAPQEEPMKTFTSAALAALLIGTAALLSGCTGLSLGWGAVQQAAPGSAAIAVTPGCQGKEIASDLPCVTATGAQNMDTVHIAIGRDSGGKPTLDVAATGIDPSRNQAIAAQALQSTVDSLAKVVAAIIPAAETAFAATNPGAAAAAKAALLASRLGQKPPPSVTVDQTAIPTSP